MQVLTRQAHASPSRARTRFRNAKLRLPYAGPLSNFAITPICPRGHCPRDAHVCGLIGNFDDHILKLVRVF